MIFYNTINDILIDGPSAVTIGKFDGLHRGHYELLRAVIEAKKEGLLSVVVSFSFKQQDQTPVRTILTAEEKKELLKDAGVDYYICIPADETFFSTTADAFLKDILIDRIHMKKMICGEDFCFGYERKGNVSFLTEKQKEYDYTLEVCPSIVFQNEKISSKRIRNCMEDGRIEEANVCLGHLYSMTGIVVHGRALGRQLGFPTANIYPEEDRLLPKFGVYHVEAMIDGKRFYGIGNLGVKPSISEGEKALLEVNFLHFDGDLYGKELTIVFLTFIRPEMKFNNLSELKERVLFDISEAEKYEGEKYAR